jgi:hypothetical protein
VTGFKLANPTLFRQMWKDGWTQFVPFVITVIAIVLTDLLIGAPDTDQGQSDIGRLYAFLDPFTAGCPALTAAGAEASTAATTTMAAASKPRADGISRNTNHPTNRVKTG